MDKERFEGILPELNFEEEKERGKIKERKPEVTSSSEREEPGAQVLKPSIPMTCSGV